MSRAVAAVLAVVGLLATACGDQAMPSGPTANVAGSEAADPAEEAPVATELPTAIPTTAATSPPAPTVTPELPAREGVVGVEYWRLAADGPSVTMDVYGAEGGGSAPPVLLLHGGGGSPEDPDVVAISSQLAGEGLTVYVPTIVRSSPQQALADDAAWVRDSFQRVVCALRHVAAGGSGRVAVVGHSAGGFLGMHSLLLDGELGPSWSRFAEDRDHERGERCTSSSAPASVASFVGFNGAYFVFQRSGVADSDPELWALLNPREHVGGDEGSVRILLGDRDAATPSWHVEEVAAFAIELETAGYDAAVETIPGVGHDWSASGPAWDALRAAVVELAGG